MVSAAHGLIIMRLSASKLTVERGGRIVFANLSFTLEAGESLTVTGPNGAGKSTLLRVLAGLLPLAWGRRSPSLRHRTRRLPNRPITWGMPMPSRAFSPSAENLQFLGAMLDAGHGGMAVDAALAEFGLSHIAGLPAAYLSAGQKRRVTLAGSSLVKRPIWLLDEPLTALDAASQALMAQIMAAHLAQGGMIVAATHAQARSSGPRLAARGICMKNTRLCRPAARQSSPLFALFMRDMRIGAAHRRRHQSRGGFFSDPRHA